MKLAVILAGGRGTRLQAGNKALVELGGQTLLQRVLDRLRLQADRVVVAVGDRSSDFGSMGVEVMPDAPGANSLPGVFRGLQSALSLLARTTGAEFVLTVPTDMPFLPRTLMYSLRPGASGVAVARDHERVHAVISSWTPAAADRGLNALARYNNESLAAFTRALGAVAVNVPLARDECLINVNTPEDLLAAEMFLATNSGTRD